MPGYGVPRRVPHLGGAVALLVVLTGLMVHVEALLVDSSERSPSWAPMWSPNETARRVSVHDQQVDEYDLDSRDARQDAVLDALQRLDGARRRPPMLKATLTQVGYIQFLRYVVDVPELRELSFCLWLRPANLSHSQPIFSYSIDERERLARAWVSPAGRGLPPRLHFSVLERAVLVEALPEAAQRRWLHLCASWDGRSGHCRLYVDGRARRAGLRPEVAGLVLPAGGDVVVGQEYTDFDKGLDDGVEGDVFGFYLFRTASPRGPPAMPSLPPPPTLEQESNHLHQLLRRRDAGGSRPAATPKRQRRQQQPWLRPAWWRPQPQQPQSFVPDRVRHLFARCADPLPPEDSAQAVVAWPTTPVRVFGGAVVHNVQGGCGYF